MLIFSPGARTMGLFERVCGLIGFKSSASDFGLIIGPPADNE
jgi:hypothetical protein